VVLASMPSQHAPRPTRPTVTSSRRRLRTRGEIIESFGERRQPPVVMAGEGPPSTTCCAGLGKGMDGRPSSAITGLDDTANIEALIYQRTLSPPHCYVAMPILPSKLQGDFGRFRPIFGRGQNRPLSPFIAAFGTKWDLRHRRDPRAPTPMRQAYRYRSGR